MPQLTRDSTDDNSQSFLIDDGLQRPKKSSLEKWKIMVVDDEEEVHSITRLVLRGFSFDGLDSVLLSCYSGEDAKRLIQEHPDTAVMLLDVVMETDQAGLDVVRFVRKELCNGLVRIILRTGQPGQAPEWRVIVEYDINDYKEKNELTAQKLVTAITSALRSYKDLRTIERLYRESKRREDLYSAVLNSSADAIVIYDMSKNVQYVNPSFTEIFGWSLTEVFGKPIPFIPNADIEVTDTILHRIMQESDPVSGIQAKLMTKDRRVLEISLSGARYHDHEKLPAGLSLILRDVTAQREAERNLELERTERGFIRDTFGQYLSDEVVNEILQCSGTYNLGGEVRDVTVLVSDLRGFTAITESLPATDILKMVNTYLEKMIQVIFDFGGTISEFLGDGILVFFGAPRFHADHPKRAVMCALEMQETMQEVNEHNLLLKLPQLTMGIGINSGELVLGSVGSEKRKQYGAVGKGINVAFRVEGKTRPGEILITEAVKGRLGDEFVFGSSWNENLKGVGGSTLYQVIGYNGTSILKAGA